MQEVLNGKGVVYRVMVSVTCLLYMHIIRSCIIYILFDFTFRVRHALVKIIIIRGSVVPKIVFGVLGLLFTNIRHVVFVVGVTPVTMQKFLLRNAE